MISNKERGSARFESLLKKIDRLDLLVTNTSEIMNNSNIFKGLKKEDKENLKSIRKESIDFLTKHLKETEHKQA